MSNKLFWTQDGCAYMSGRNVLILLLLSVGCFALGWYSKPREVNIAYKTIIRDDCSAIDLQEVCYNTFKRDKLDYSNQYMRGYDDGTRDCLQRYYKYERD